MCFLEWGMGLGNHLYLFLWSAELTGESDICSLNPNIPFSHICLGDQQIKIIVRSETWQFAWSLSRINNKPIDKLSRSADWARTQKHCVIVRTRGRKCCVIEERGRLKLLQFWRRRCPFACSNLCSFPHSHTIPVSSQCWKVLYCFSLSSGLLTVF